MTLKRGMFRLWLVCSVAWVTLIFAIGFSTGELGLTAPPPADDNFAEFGYRNIRFVEEMTNHTPDSITALLNTSYWYLDNTPQVKKLNGKIPLLYFTREEWNAAATKWAKANTPEAKVISFGKY
jgi:hypothetical protein